MTSLADRVITSMRTQHDQLSSLIGTLDDDGLTAPSGAAEWRVCDVLSHLGSGAEIMLAPFRAAADGVPAPQGDNQAVWDRWNARSPREQAQGYVDHGDALVELLEGLSPEQRDSVAVDLGFLPEPVPLEVAAGMRLNELTQHAWDVNVGFDPSAGVDPVAADLLLELLTGPLSFLLGFTGKPDAISEQAEVTAGSWGLVVDDGVRLIEAGSNPTATFTGSPEALLRLLGGRLSERYTPAGTEVTGNVTLDDLRKVFPGY